MRASIAKIALLAAASVALAGCELILGLERTDRSGSSVEPGNGDDPGPDAGAGGGGVPSGECTVPSNLDGLEEDSEASGLVDFTAEGRVVAVTVLLDGSANPDVLVIALREGFGPFSQGITSGSFTLGEELDPDTCGVCVGLGGDVNPFSLVPSQTYLATSGTLFIEAVSLPGDDEGDPDGGFIAAGVGDVVFDDYECVGPGDAGVSFGGCSSSLDFYFFEVGLTPGSAAYDGCRSSL
jgi:hypothetical protein